MWDTPTSGRILLAQAAHPHQAFESDTSAVASRVQKPAAKSRRKPCRSQPGLSRSWFQECDSFYSMGRYVKSTITPLILEQRNSSCKTSLSVAMHTRIDSSPDFCSTWVCWSFYFYFSLASKTDSDCVFEYHMNTNSSPLVFSMALH